MRDAANEARLERQRKILGRFWLYGHALCREVSLQSSSGEKEAAPTRKEGKRPDSANQHDEVGEQTGTEEAQEPCSAVHLGIAQ